jgi:hypothetical protein
MTPSYELGANGRPRLPPSRGNARYFGSPGGSPYHGSLLIGTGYCGLGR